MWRRGVLRAWAVAAAARSGLSGLRMICLMGLAAGRGGVRVAGPRAAAVDCEPGVVSRVC